MREVMGVFIRDVMCNVGVKVRNQPIDIARGRMKLELRQSCFGMERIISSILQAYWLIWVIFLVSKNQGI
jgi:hypothetical protein